MVEADYTISLLCDQFVGSQMNAESCCCVAEGKERHALCKEMYVTLMHRSQIFLMQKCF